MKMTWSMVVIHEDDETRKEAMKFCDKLVERFWSEHEFDLAWASFAEVIQETTATELAARTAQADIVLLATRPNSDLPTGIEIWMENWAAQRGDREGLMVTLNEPNPITGRKLPEKFVFLRNLAHHAGMDYLTRMPEEITRSIPDSLDSFSARAQQVTNVLDEILHRPTGSARLAG